MCPENAHRFRRVATEALDPSEFAVHASANGGLIFLEIRDIASVDGWRVVLHFAPGADDASVRDRVRKAVAPRSLWATA